MFPGSSSAPSGTTNSWTPKYKSSGGSNFVPKSQLNNIEIIEKEKENKYKSNNRKFDKANVPVVSTGGNRKERREIIFRPENARDGISEKKNESKSFSKDENKIENPLKKSAENSKIVKIEDTVSSNEIQLQNVTVKTTEKSAVTAAAAAALPEISDSVFLSFLLTFRYLF